jgi:hypothetical protein
MFLWFMTIGIKIPPRGVRLGLATMCKKGWAIILREVFAECDRHHLNISSTNYRTALCVVQNIKVRASATVCVLVQDHAKNDRHLLELLIGVIHKS